MYRRDFLKAGTLAGAAGLVAVSSSSCAILPGRMTSGQGIMALPDMDAYLDQVDDGLQRISRWSLAPEASRHDQDFRRENELGRKALRTLYLTAMFGDLPEEGQVHPGMQERMWRAMPEMDESVFGMRYYLQSRTASQREDLRLALRGHPNPGKAIAEELNEHAALCGLSRRRRLQTHSMVTQITWRMRNQHPDLVFDDYVEKIDKLSARNGSIEEYQRRQVARMGEKAFWERQERLAALSRRWQSEGRAKAPVERSIPQGRVRRGQGVMIGGGVAMGVGAVVTGLGAAILYGADSILGAFVMTAGAIGLVAGLITLIVGVIIYAATG